ncbi:MAG: acetyl-CoA carboxylase biotin carboxylase subunit, partial [Myxococcota bacterium]
DRDEAIRIGKRALREVIVEGPGISTTVPLHLEILNDPLFVDADFDTSYLDTFLSK